MIIENVTKPVVALPTVLSINPSRNYAFHLLRDLIERVNPTRSLDAGIGELRNFWMFPGKYVGIGNQRWAYFKGLTEQPTAELIKRRGVPETYLMRLESDFSFLGSFDLAVCTATIFYVQDQVDVLRRLSERVDKGGALIFDAKVSDLELFRPVLDQCFEAAEITYWGHSDCFGKKPEISLDAHLALARREMMTPNRAEGHKRFTILATGKRQDPGAAGPRPEIVEDRGLLMVKADMPYVEM